MIYSVQRYISEIILCSQHSRRNLKVVALQATLRLMRYTLFIVLFRIAGSTSFKRLIGFSCNGPFCEDFMKLYSRLLE